MDNGLNNIFDGNENGWSVALFDNVNIGEWLRENEENIVFKIYINQVPKYFLSNLDNLEQTLSNIFFGCDLNTRVLLNETYVNLKYVGMDHFLLKYTDDLWKFFYTNPNSDINSEYSFGQSISSRKKLAKRCFYLKTDEQTVSISATPIKIPSDYYTDYLLNNILPPINCSQIDSTYLLITGVEYGKYKNSLDEESTIDNPSTISDVTSESIDWRPKPSPDNSDSDVSPMTSPERGGRTRKHKHKNKLKKTKKSKKTKNQKDKKSKKTKKSKKSKRQKN